MKSIKRFISHIYGEKSKKKKWPNCNIFTSSVLNVNSDIKIIYPKIKLQWKFFPKVNEYKNRETFKANRVRIELSFNTLGKKYTV